MMDFISEYKEYVITTAIGLAVAVIIILSRGIFSAEEAATVITILSDAFFIPGVLLLCVGLILFASNEGLFLGIAYGFKVIGRTITAKKDEKLVNEEYHEYYARMIQKKIKMKHFLLIGTIFVVISIIFVVLYFFVA